MTGISVLPSRGTLHGGDAEAQPRREECTELCGIRTRVPAMRRVLDTIKLVADLDEPVLICGETGTGKELVAGALHALGGRSRKPMATVHCGALSESIAESELFGHERGAFTGADRSYGGRIEGAAGGTLFLDEVNSLSRGVQTKLLRFLDVRELSRVGRQRPLTVDVRLVSATNVPLQDLVACGEMRADFFHRLNVLTLELPALRDRRPDIPLLVEQFLATDPLAKRFGVTEATGEVESELCRMPWPGNVRELHHTLRRSLIRGVRGSRLTRLEKRSGGSPFSGENSPRVARDVGFRAWMQACEREYLTDLLRRHRTASEQVLASGLPQRTLHRKIQDLKANLSGEAPRRSETRG